jgi:hypothetical protein
MCKNIKSKEFQTFLNKFALSAKVKTSDTTVTTLTIWGFGSLVDEAMEYIKHGGAALLSSSRHSHYDVTEPAVILDTSSEVVQPIIFKEKEMGFYYLALENEFNRYLLQTYNVAAIKAEVDFSLTTKKNFPPVKVLIKLLEMQLSKLTGLLVGGIDRGARICAGSQNIHRPHGEERSVQSLLP